MLIFNYNFILVYYLLYIYLLNVNLSSNATLILNSSFDDCIILLITSFNFIMIISTRCFSHLITMHTQWNLPILDWNPSHLTLYLLYEKNSMSYN